MTKKVKLAIFDKDLKARTVKEYPISDNGEQIKVVSGGEGHFMPKFDNDSFIELPRPWYRGGGWEKIYFARKLAKKCVNFKTEEVFVPDPEQLKKSIGVTLLDQLGEQKQPFPAWTVYLILVTVIGIALKVFGVIA